MVKRYVKQIYDTALRPEMRILPGHLAFFLILSIFPLFTLIGVICSKFDIFSSVFVYLGDVLPTNILDILLPFMADKNVSGNFIFFMFLGFIIASNGTFSIITVSDEIYDIPYDNYIKRRVKAFLMIFILLLLFLFLFVVLAYGNMIVDFLVNLDFLVNFKDKIYLFFMILKWPVAFLVIFLLIKGIYTIAPSLKIPSKYMNKGALFSTFFFILFTYCYSFYVSHFANYDVFYGSISNIIVLMIWIYALSYILTMGIAINSNNYLNNKENLGHNS